MTTYRNTALPAGYLKNIEDMYMSKMRDIREIPDNGYFIENVREIQMGYERELEDIAKQVIKDFYGSIIDDVILDLRIVPFGTLKSPKTTSHTNLSYFDAHVSKNVEIDTLPENVKQEIYKRKICNCITQGEAKNVHRIIHFEEYRKHINKIHPKLFYYYDSAVKNNEMMDWIMQPNKQFDDWKSPNNNHFCGIVRVDWSESKPKIVARATDLPILLHETVKGIYELITANGIPEDKELAKKVLKYTDTMEDEIEDLRYGQGISVDFRSFILSRPNMDKYSNIYEFVLSKMMKLPAPEFNLLVRMILNKKKDANAIVDRMIEETISELSQYTIDSVTSQIENNVTEIDDKYKNLSHSDIDKLINDALESGNYSEIDKLRKLL